MISPEQLRRYPYFANVKEESLRKVAMFSNEVTVSSGTVVFNEGDVAEFLYIINEGEINIQYTLGSGEKRTVDTVVAGEMIMWSALVEPFKSTATGTANSDMKMIAIDARQLREICEVEHDLGYRMLISLTRLLAGRLEGARVQLATID